MVNKHNYENHSWVNQLFLLPFSMAFCLFTRGFNGLYHIFHTLPSGKLT